MNGSPIKHANHKPRALKAQYTPLDDHKESTFLLDKNSLDAIDGEKMLRKKLKNKFPLLSKTNQKQKVETAKETPSFPMSSQRAQSVFAESLSETDRESIPHYEVVHYYSSAEAFSKSSHIAFRFEVISSIGEGKFGKVYECMDHKNTEIVAIKVLKSSAKVLEQGKVEINILKTLNSFDPSGSKHIVKLKKSFSFNGKICLVLELLDMNLYHMLKLEEFKGLDVSVVKSLAKQLLEALDYTRRHNIIHCDLKPENILIQPDHELKLIDFGSGCFAEHQFNTNIQSQYYRAPEILLGIEYTTAIDMWSFGCLLYELYKGRPLFSGSDEVEQLIMIIEAIGYPPDDLVDKGSRSYLFFNDENDMEILSRRNLLRELDSDMELTDLIVRCLVWTPHHRLTPKQGLQHPWICSI